MTVDNEEMDKWTELHIKVRMSTKKHYEQYKDRMSSGYGLFTGDMVMKKFLADSERADIADSSLSFQTLNKRVIAMCEEFDSVSSQQFSESNLERLRTLQSEITKTMSRMESMLQGQKLRVFKIREDNMVRNIFVAMKDYSTPIVSLTHSDVVM